MNSEDQNSMDYTITNSNVNERKRRVGSHGSFKMNKNVFEKDASKRKKTEEGKFKTIKEKVNQLKKVTRTPIAVLAFTANGKLKSFGSSRGMLNFARDPVVVEKFLELMKDDFIVEEDSEEESTESEDDEQEEQEAPSLKKNRQFAFNAAWYSLSAEPKRKYLADATRAFSHSPNFSWTRENCKPKWWPANVKFRSPHGKSKIPVGEMDCVLHSLHEHKVLNCVKRNSSTMPMVTDFAQMKSESNKFVESVMFVINWLTKFRKRATVSLIDMELSCRHLTVSKFGTKEPVTFNTIGACLSHHFFGTEDYCQFFERLGLALAIKKFDDLVDCISNGKFEIPARTYQNWFDSFDEKTLQDTLFACTSDTPGSKVLIYVFAIALVLEKNLRVLDDCITDIVLDRDSTFDIGLLLNTPNVTYMADVEEYDPAICRSHNLFCVGRENDEHMKCQNCALTYHTPCVNWQEDTCGCEKIESTKLRIIDMFQTDSINNFLRLLYKSNEKITRFATNLLERSSRSARGDLIVRLLSDGKCDELRMMNAFSKKIPQQVTRTLTEIFRASSVLEGKRLFEEQNHERVIAEFLIPEVLTYLIQMDTDHNLPELVIERACYIARLLL